MAARELYVTADGEPSDEVKLESLTGQRRGKERKGGDEVAGVGGVDLTL